MNNKLRQKILKELNVLLKEQAGQVDTSDGKSGGSYGSGTAGRIAGTSAIGAGAAAIPLGVAAAGIGAGTISAAAGGGAIGAAAGGLSAGLATPAAPIVAVGLIALGALYLAFRTAGWQEVSEDIMDAKIESNNPLASQLLTGKYIDLTNMTDVTDLSDFKSFMAAMKGLAKRFGDVKDLQEYAKFMDNASSLKSVTNKICDQYVLLNETGLNDRMYYVKCAKLRAYNIPAGLVPVAPTAAPQQESLKRKNKKFLLEADAVPAGVPPAQMTAKCTIIPDLKIPVELYDVGLEDDIEDPSIGPARVPQNQLPDITSPLVEQTCGISPTPAPGPDIGPVNTSCKKCKDINIGCKGPDVAEIHNALIGFNPAFKVSGAQEIASQTFGAQTADAIIKFKEQRKFMSPPYTAKVGPSTCKALGISGGGGKGGGGKPNSQAQGKEEFEKSLQQAIKSKLDAGQKKEEVDAWAEDQRQAWARSIYDTTAGKASPGVSVTRESKNYYDNKKLNEAKTLFNKLLKNL